MNDQIPPWMSEKSRRRKQNRDSQRMEREHAQTTGGKVQPGSGSSYRAPEDVVGPLDREENGFLDQHKFTRSKGFRITADEWTRLRANARRSGREPRLVVEFPERGIKLYVTEPE